MGKKIRIFDYPQFAQGLRDELIAHAKKIASENNLSIQYLPKKNFRQEECIAEILKRRGTHPGLVHIFSVQESCASYTPWHDKNTHKTFLKYDPSGRCLHYYFYFIHEILGLCYVRVPTWIPFRLQVYFNGHNWLGEQKGVKSLLLTNLSQLFGSSGKDACCHSVFPVIVFVPHSRYYSLPPLFPLSQFR
ncbi:MAG: hypothetical protein IT420_11120 [Candidatus Brocadia sp.]|nr:hypothetical protein [Candidatus Brocadia sp.]MDG5996891.1 hypothetical protein [Candidatus Brocadia sp.]